ncbi:HAMP domain-containing histidine kinase [Niastella caeni]|uniref:histidine kinase n=1 Tax=Niastella caeni TaxID=2569763 RepID=A0A4V4H1V1_9BACT|nr:HAMP domain-containing sensor histidine kinase [Niastella caeni]THU41886.1 HAMP domain-containing histidine kinase [Niastella caeni]
MKIQTQTALLFTVLTALLILFISITTYYFVSRFASNDFLKRLELRVRVAAKLRFEQNKISTDTYKELRRQYLEVLPQEQEYLLIWDSATNVIHPQAQSKLPKSFYQKIIAAQGNTVFIHKNKVHYAGILYRDEGHNYLVIKSAVNEYANTLLYTLARAKIATFVVGVLLVFTVGIFFSRKTFQPLRQLISKVQDISAHNLHLRLETKKGKDEMTELAHTFNTMLDRLQTAFETQNNFVSNASHELRTPLTTIIGEAEVALKKARTDEEYRQSLQIILNEAGKLDHLTHSLLALAQSGFDGKKQRRSLVRMDELLWEVKQAVDELHPNNRVQLHLGELPPNEQQLAVEGNYHLLKLALTNIAVNACKYSNNRPVQLSLQVVKKKIRISIIDEGIGIPASDLKYVFEPFYRASNTDRYEGHGVGLPLARNIIRLHNGELVINSVEGKGTAVEITLHSQS